MRTENGNSMKEDAFMLLLCVSPSRKYHKKIITAQTILILPTFLSEVRLAQLTSVVNCSSKVRDLTHPVTVSTESAYTNSVPFFKILFVCVFFK